MGKRRPSGRQDSSIAGSGRTLRSPESVGRPLAFRRTRSCPWRREAAHSATTDVHRPCIAAGIISCHAWAGLLRSFECRIRESACRSVRISLTTSRVVVWLRSIDDEATAAALRRRTPGRATARWRMLPYVVIGRSATNDNVPSDDDDRPGRSERDVGLERQLVDSRFCRY